MNTLNANKVAALVPSTMSRASKRDFYHQQVVDLEGKVTSDELIHKLIPQEVTGRALTFQLKKFGMRKVWVFDESSYKVEMDKYHQSKELQKDALIAEAFNQASTTKEPHIEHALQKLMPLFKGVSAKKTLIAFRNIVQNVNNANRHDNALLKH